MPTDAKLGYCTAALLGLLECQLTAAPVTIIATAATQCYNIAVADS